LEVDRPFPPLPQNLAEIKMTEERKHAILFAATLLFARRLIENIESDKAKMNEQYFIDKAIDRACVCQAEIIGEKRKRGNVAAFPLWT
jgi:hypothetical protein